MSFNCTKDDEDCINSSLVFTVTKRDKENNLIVIEACYNITFTPCYGF